MTQPNSSNQAFPHAMIDVSIPIQGDLGWSPNSYTEIDLEGQLQEFLDEKPILRFTVIREADGTFLFSDEMAAAFALGDTFQEAVVSYLETVQDVFEVMSEGKEPLLARDRRKLQCLRELLE